MWCGVLVQELRSNYFERLIRNVFQTPHLVRDISRGIFITRLVSGTTFKIILVLLENQILQWRSFRDPLDSILLISLAILDQLNGLHVESQLFLLILLTSILTKENLDTYEVPNVQKARKKNIKTVVIALG